MRNSAFTCVIIAFHSASGSEMWEAFFCVLTISFVIAGVLFSTFIVLPSSPFLRFIPELISALDSGGGGLLKLKVV